MTKHLPGQRNLFPVQCEATDFAKNQQTSCASPITQKSTKALQKLCSVKTPLQAGQITSQKMNPYFYQTSAQQELPVGNEYASLGRNFFSGEADYLFTQKPHLSTWTPSHPFLGKQHYISRDQGEVISTTSTPPHRVYLTDDGHVVAQGRALSLRQAKARRAQHYVNNYYFESQNHDDINKKHTFPALWRCEAADRVVDVVQTITDTVGVRVAEALRREDENMRFLARDFAQRAKGHQFMAGNTVVDERNWKLLGTSPYANLVWYEDL